jgi:extracellular elastinolytic metalloproteinase
MKNQLFISFCIMLFCANVMAQKQTKLDIALRFIEGQKSAWNLSESDIGDLSISDMYQSDHNGVTHIYFIQRYQGIEIHNAITSVHITKDGKIFESPTRFYSNIKQKINTTKNRLSATDALVSVVKHLDISNALVPKNVSRTQEGKTEIAKTNFTHNNIPVKQVYCEDKNGNLRLAWDLTMDMSVSNDYWSIRVDAINGDILDQQNLNIKCRFDHPGHKRCIENQKVVASKNIPVKEALIQQHTKSEFLPSVPNSYNVVPVPGESPRHLPRSVVVNPAIQAASPYGWHDTNGAAGAEYTITRGNNVWAYPDRNGDNVSDRNEPDGGTDLMFDFPFDQSLEPGSYLKAATVNLFYMINMMHDVSYLFGFNEVAGNFQFSNYGKGGAGNDHVLGEAQDGSGTDNANFATPADGGSGRMQMFLWLSSGAETYIAKPDSLIGNIDSRRASGWGGAPPPNILADAVIANDYSNNPTLGCTNGFKNSEVAGKIVLIDRGTCEFGLKSLNAQRAGAAAVIICNFEDAFVTMGAGAVGNQVTIPAYFTTRTICNRLKLMIANGELKIEIREPGSNSGPDTLDGDFDNGVIAHEFGHGISNRLTGGPSRANCLGNGEQMGEGWSDFFSLIMTARPGDVGTLPRGIGTYVQNENPDGYGIRRRQYTTDMSVNEFTYKNIINQVHALGEVWATVTWDLYWALADKYGYDPDFTNKTAGNNIAIQLVMDGMKLQPCSPGFIDGRNAILKADSINNQAKNSCLIWEVFARRGMGYFANQGSTNVVLDETESFLPALVCVDKLLVDKRPGYYKDATTFVRNDVVKPGEQYSFTIEIHNYKAGTANNVVVVDNIPAGCTYVPGSGVPAPAINGNQLSWTFSQLASLETRRITYKLTSSPAISSTTLWFDDVENGQDNWDLDLAKGDRLWYIGDLYGIDQSRCWIAEEGGRSGDEGSDDFSLFTFHPFHVSGQDPSLYFNHFYNTEKGFDGGMIEVSKDGFFWQQAKPESFSLNGYNGLLNYQTFVIPNVKAFSGQSGGYIASVMSLSDYMGENIHVRFRFGNDSLGVSPDNSTILGWLIDNVEFIYPQFYNAEVCVTTNEGDNICLSSPGKGVLADSDKIVKTNDNKVQLDYKIYPNPAADYFLVRLDPEHQYRQLQIKTINGQDIKTVNIDKNSQLVKISSTDLPKGIVILEIIGEHKRTFTKLLIK